MQAGYCVQLNLRCIGYRRREARDQPQEPLAEAQAEHDAVRLGHLVLHALRRILERRLEGADVERIG